MLVFSKLFSIYFVDIIVMAGPLNSVPDGICNIRFGNSRQQNDLVFRIRTFQREHHHPEKLQEERLRDDVILDPEHFQMVHSFKKYAMSDSYEFGSYQILIAADIQQPVPCRG